MGNVVEGGLASMVLQPVRFRIISLLHDAGEPLYIDQIADRIGENRRLVSFHLMTLEDAGIVRSEFRILEGAKSKGRAGRFFTLAEKADDVFAGILKVLGGRFG